MASRSLALPWGLSGLCARCTFFWLGFSVFLFLARLPLRSRASVLAGGLLLLLPMSADGLMQSAGLYESVNSVRVITGLLGGSGAAMALRALLCGRDSSC